MGLLKKKSTSNEGINTEYLLKEIDRLIDGDMTFADEENCEDKEVAKKINALISTIFAANNNFVMRANEAMQSIGDNSYSKSMLDQVSEQKNSIDQIEKSSGNLESSINNINNYVDTIKGKVDVVHSTTVTTAENITAKAQVVHDTSDEIEEINKQLQDLNEKIEKISEIVETVKDVAGQSNLLALNASIEAARAGEAGKGFAVVADQVREMSTNTAQLADGIGSQVEEIQHAIGVLAPKMDATSNKLMDGAKDIEKSVAGISEITNRMDDVKGALGNIYKAVSEQNAIKGEFTDSMNNLLSTYESLYQECHNFGVHIYKIGRYVDTLRSDMYRSFSKVHPQDNLKIFEIDHFILTWRIYNNIVGFETLRRAQVDNPTGDKACKLGKWIQSNPDKELVASPEFKALDAAHKKLHDYATKSWDAKDAGDETKALEHFNNMLTIGFPEYQKAIAGLKEFERRRGNTEVTEIVVFNQ